MHGCMLLKYEPGLVLGFSSIKIFRSVAFWVTVLVGAMGTLLVSSAISGSFSSIRVSLGSIGVLEFLKMFAVSTSGCSDNWIVSSVGRMPRLDRSIRSNM